MGPMFYLVQSHGVRDPISAVILGNWPHEFALAPSPGKKGGRTSPGSVCAGFLRPRGPAAEKKKLEMRSSLSALLPAQRSHACCCGCSQTVTQRRDTGRMIS